MFIRIKWAAWREGILNPHDLAVQRGNSPYFGGIVGRVANRIANGSFVVDGQRYTTDKNDRGNTLHGGFNPFFENNTWTIEEASDKEVRLSLLSPDGTQVSPLLVLQLLPSSVFPDISLAADLQVDTLAGGPHACRMQMKNG